MVDKILFEICSLSDEDFRKLLREMCHRWPGIICISIRRSARRKKLEKYYCCLIEEIDEKTSS
jgi:hypothetical protein